MYGFNDLHNRMATPLNREEAFIGILLASIAANGHLREEKVERFNGLVHQTRLMRQVSSTQFRTMVEKLFRLLQVKGPIVLIQESTAQLPGRFREGTFVMACELLCLGGPSEKLVPQLFEALRTGLFIPSHRANQIMEVILSKNQL